MGRPVPIAAIAGWSAGAAALGVSLALSLACAPPVTMRSVFEDRTTVAQLPIAPPPPGARRDVDVSVRQAFATLVDGGDVAAPAPTGLPSIATEGAISLRLGRFVGLRFFGAGSYGPVVGSDPSAVRFPTEGVGAGGLGFLAGSWGTAQTWSVHVELDASLANLPSRDRYREESRTCRGPAESDCTAWVVGGHHVDTGTSLLPLLGLTIDAAGEVLPWLRLGGGLSIQTMGVRDLERLGYAPVGLARLWAELRYDDASIVIELQQPVLERFVLGPIVAITLRGAFFDRLTGPRPPPPRRPPPPPGLGGWAPPP